MRARVPLVLALLVPGGAAHGEEPGPRIAVSAAVAGQLVPASCGPDAAPPAFARVAGKLAGAGAVVLDAGDLLGSAAVSRLVVERDASGLAAAVAAAGYRALAVGHRDLAAPRATLIAAATALDAAGAPYVLGNLACAPAAAALCAVLHDAGDPPLLLDTPAGKLAFLAAAAPATLSRVARDRAAGLTLLPPAAVLPQQAVRARELGAVAVVAVLDPTWRAELADALTLAAAFPPEAGPVTLLVHGLPGGVDSLRTRSAEVDGAPGRVTVIATAAADAIAVSLDGGAARALPPGEAPAAVRDFVAAAGASLCAAHARPLPGAALPAGALDRDGFAALFLDVLREQAEADVGILNRAGVRAPERFPLSGALGELDVLSALPFDDTLELGRMKGAALKALATGPAAALLHLRGVSVVGGAVRVNGRPLDETASYRVVTTGFVAGGGDGALAPGLAWTRLPGAPRERLLAWLARPRPGDVRLAPVDPARRARWSLRFSVDAAAADIRVKNPSPTTYSDAQLVRAESTSARVDAEARADADHPLYAWENGVRLRYGVARTVTQGGVDSGFVENLDLSSARSVATYRAFAKRRWFHPLPFAEGYLETELDPPPAGRAYHHLQLRPTAGARFELLGRMTASLGAGVNWEALDPARGVEPVVVAAWTLRPGRLLTLGGRAVEGQANLELSWRDPGGRDDALVRAGAKLALPLFGAVSLTIGYDVFGRHLGASRWAASGDAVAGLKVASDRAVQTF